MKAVPILHLPKGTSVTAMFEDDVTSSVFLGLSDGRIIKCDEVTMLGSLTGARSINAEVIDGFGFTMPSASLDILYALHNRLIEINSSKSSLVWKAIESPFSATIKEKVTGIFTSQVMWAGHDLGFWKDIYWEEDAPSGCETVIYLRSAESKEDIVTASWESIISHSGVKNLAPSGESSSSSETSDFLVDSLKYRRSLDHFNKTGNYIQLRAELSTTVLNISPTIYNATISYQTKHSVYFFTQKFNMAAGASSDGIIITGSQTAPQNTEVKFGIAKDNTSNWKEYSIIEPDSIMNMPEGIRDKFKIGIKFTSSDPTAYATVDEFSVMLGGDKQTELNK